MFVLYYYTSWRVRLCPWKKNVGEFLFNLAYDIPRTPVSVHKKVQPNRFINHKSIKFCQIIMEYSFISSLLQKRVLLWTGHCTLWLSFSVKRILTIAIFGSITVKKFFRIRKAINRCNVSWTAAKFNFQSLKSGFYFKLTFFDNRFVKQG